MSFRGEMNSNEIFGNTIRNIYKHVIYPRSIRARALSGKQEFSLVHREVAIDLPEKNLSGDEKRFGGNKIDALLANFQYE